MINDDDTKLIEKLKIILKKESKKWTPPKGKVKELLDLREKMGGDFTFSITYFPEFIEEIHEMGPEFFDHYMYSISDPRVFAFQVITISKI